MKRFVLLSFLMSLLILSGCQRDLESDKTMDTGSEGIAKVQLGEQLEKKPMRMFNIDGELYYDSGLVSENAPRCGTLDGKLKKTVKENEIPLNSGEANFEIDGYQNATSITKEVNLDGKWVIFKKYNTFDESLDGLKYCYYIKGHLNNAATDGEFVVLTDNTNVSYDDIVSPMLSFVDLNDKDKCRISCNIIESGDKWGLSLCVGNVTAKGLTLKIEQFGGNPSGELQMGAAYFLETTIDDEWQPVETITGQPLVWNSIAYMIKMNDITEMDVNWQYGYGELKSGFYRLKKEITDFRAPGDYDKKSYEVYFNIQ